MLLLLLLLLLPLERECVGILKARTGEPPCAQDFLIKMLMMDDAVELMMMMTTMLMMMIMRITHMHECAFCAENYCVQEFIVNSIAQVCALKALAMRRSVAEIASACGDAKL